MTLLVLRGKTAEREANGNDQPTAQGFDLLGLVLSMTGFTAFVYGINKAGTDGWGNSTVLPFLVGGGVLLLAFIVVELLVRDPVMDLRLFRSYTFAIANILVWATSAVFFASLFLVPLLFEQVQGLSALTTGEFLISQGLAMAAGLMISGKLYNKVGPRLLALAGAVIVTISMIGFTRLDVTTTGGDLQVWLILRGLGLGLVTQPAQSAFGSAWMAHMDRRKALSLRERGPLLRSWSFLRGCLKRSFV